MNDNSTTKKSSRVVGPATWLLIWCAWLLIVILPIRLTNSTADQLRYLLGFLWPTILSVQLARSRRLPRIPKLIALPVLVSLQGVILIIALMGTAFNSASSIVETIDFGKYKLEDHSSFVFNQGSTHELLLVTSVIPGVEYVKTIGRCEWCSLNLKKVGDRTVEFDNVQYHYDKPERRQFTVPD